VVKFLDLASGDGDVSPKTTLPEQVSQLGLQRFFEISLSLMIVTLGLAYAWYKWERRSIDRKDGPFSEKPNLV